MDFAELNYKPAKVSLKQKQFFFARLPKYYQSNFQIIMKAITTAKIC